MATKTPKPADTGAPMVEESQFMSKGWKRFWIISFSIVFGICLVYGVWRLAGGRFTPAPDPACATDAQKRISLGGLARINSTDLTANLNFADYLYDCKDYSFAAESYQKAVQLTNVKSSVVSDADRFKAQFGLALSYFYGGKIKESQPELEAASKLQPNNQVVLYTWGVSLKEDNPARAKELWQKAIQLNPTSTIAQEAQKALNETK
jgi:tetratricopeptide (TPR) repeat protein